jgi:hypothetical protein
MKHIIAIAALTALTGCASVTNGTTQSVSFDAQHDGKSITADCTVKGEYGTQSIRVPDSMRVKRSYDDLTVTCRKDGFPDGISQVISRTSQWMWNNLVVGGGIGALIDHNTGAAYRYPDAVVVRMGYRSTEDALGDAFGPKDSSRTPTKLDSHKNIELATKQVSTAAPVPVATPKPVETQKPVAAPAQKASEPVVTWSSNAIIVGKPIYEQLGK